MAIYDIDHFVETVSTGYPQVHMIACKRCGVLLWDIGSHYYHAHNMFIKVRDNKVYTGATAIDID